MSKTQKIDSELLYSKLKYRNLISEKKLIESHSGSIKLLESRGVRLEKLRKHATKFLASGALAGVLLLPATLPPSQQPQPNVAVLISQPSLNESLSNLLSSALPKETGKLTQEQELKIIRIFKEICGIDTAVELDENRLNHNYGLIGAEQHLPRFPGDTLEQHEQYLREGITPGLGGWGYFAYSKNQLTPDLVEKEKYYVAVQTLYLPDWNTRTAYLSRWYKYRKVIVANPVNGKVVIADVADAGPADWTGKDFGGSPEVMAYLNLNVGMQKGPVVLFFVDDPDDKIPLGPVEYNQINSKLMFKQI